MAPRGEDAAETTSSDSGALNKNILLSGREMAPRGEDAEATSSDSGALNKNILLSGREMAPRGEDAEATSSEDGGAPPQPPTNLEITDWDATTVRLKYAFLYHIFTTIFQYFFCHHIELFLDNQFKAGIGIEHQKELFFFYSKQYLNKNYKNHLQGSKVFPFLFDSKVCNMKNCFYVFIVKNGAV
jgi:hypothetical protein